MHKQTIFKHQGYMMRSHSETRWAEVMDALGIQWIYEPQLVKTRHGWYLPDFYLPGAGIYLEVKGPKPSQLEIDKARDLQDAAGCPVIFAWGDMRTCGLEVIGGYLTALHQCGAVLFTTHELGSVVREGLGQPYQSRFIRAGIKRPAPSASLMGDILEEVLFRQQDRNEQEQAKAQHHARLNQVRIGECRQQSKAEWALSALLRRSGRSMVAA
ncbi:conserved protein of unknown function [Pseudomonas marincola]|uniref:Uncharacterized protein n=1 Tax=Pseudomonas marincola TaxID=437900 RepID=A0A653E6H3_9PSED|nr:hypothetical protein [Pseudomonas marincola]CAE6906321.1 conserved protein of unknown function [Pseudomonas marincola]